VRQPLRELVGVGAAPSRRAERLGQLDEVGRAEVDAEVATELLVLLPDDRAELAVLPDHVHDRGLEADRGLQLLAVHEKAAVAADGDHVAMRVDELGGDGRRQGEAHPRQTVGDQHRARLVGREHAADPELVQADV